MDRNAVERVGHNPNVLVFDSNVKWESTFWAEFCVTSQTSYHLFFMNTLATFSLPGRLFPLLQLVSWLANKLIRTTYANTNFNVQINLTRLTRRLAATNNPDWTRLLADVERRPDAIDSTG